MARVLTFRPRPVPVPPALPLVDLETLYDDLVELAGLMPLKVEAIHRYAQAQLALVSVTGGPGSIGGAR